MWSDQAQLSAGVRARNRRELRAAPDRATRHVVTGGELRGETPAPPRFLFLRVPPGQPSPVRSVAVVKTADQIAASPSGVERRSLAGESRDAILIRTGGSIALPAQARGSAVLAFGLSAVGRAPVRARLMFAAGATETLLFAGEARGAAWRDVRVPWPSHGSGALRLTAEGEPDDALVWSNPRVVTETREARAPNVVLYVVDTLRADRVGLYGASATATPFLDRLGRAGVLCERAYTAATWTKPSVASLLTGLYPRTHGLGARYYSDPLPVGVRTLQARFAAAGYTTAQFSANPLTGALSNLDRGFDQAFAPEAFAAGRRKVRADDLNRLVLPWLEAHAGERFFLYVQSLDAHPPYRLPAGSTGEGGDRPASYEEAIAFGDDQVARLEGRLAALGLASQTLFVVTADHGEAFGEHGRTGHGQSVYEEESRVPLVLRGPGLAAGSRVRGAVSLVDLAPTLLDLSAVAYDAGSFQGRSFAPSIRSGGGVSGGAARPVFLTRFAYPEDPGRSVADRSDVDAVVAFPWKLIAVRPEGAAPHVELYDVEKDPAERRDLSQLEADRARELGRVLDRFLAAQAQARVLFLAEFASSTPFATPTLAPDADERLKSLGYVR